MTEKPSTARSSGRRPGSDSSSKHILVTARHCFAETGFNGTSLRTVALKAGVDPSTVIHFFGTKEGLFTAVVQDIVPAMHPFIDALRRNAKGEELVSVYLQIWEDDLAGGVMRAVIRTSLTSDKSINLLKETLTKHILDAIQSTHPIRAELVLMQLIGIGIGRYIAQLPELTNIDIALLAKTVGPVLDHYRSAK